jgi:hypothetical protein
MKTGDVMNRFVFPLTFLALMLVAVVPSTSDVNRNGKTRKGEELGEDIQRTPRGVFDQQGNTKSRINFQVSNYGIFGFNIAQGVGGTFWPRGSSNQYIFAGGAWFGARKRIEGSDTLRKRVFITYNPNSGRSWMVPGSIEDGVNVNTSADAINKNRLYFSSDYDEESGSDITNSKLPSWPVWDTSPTNKLREDNYFGYYVNDINARTTTASAKSKPAFISGEDIFCVYKDTDLSRYEGGAPLRKSEGFPFGMQIEQNIFSWGFGEYADILFLKYVFIHPKQYSDTLYDCWMAAVQDVDIALQSASGPGAQNDRARYYNEEPDMNLAVQWTNGDRGETGRGFGYLGFNFLESPAVDADKFLRKDKNKFPVQEQLGLQTLRNWPITEDPLQNEDRYNFISSQRRDGDLGPGDRRLMMATGPFHMRPGDTARIVVGIILAPTATGGDATGTTEDLKILVKRVKFAEEVYRNSFIAPKAPALSVIKGMRNGAFPEVPAEGWLGLNNGVAIQWDSTSEQSIDTLERGLDFMGYRIYRARRNDLDTFDLDLRDNDRSGPLGWKQIAQYGVPAPFLKWDSTEIVTRVGSGLIASTGYIQIPLNGLKLDKFDLADVIKPGQRRVLLRRSLNGQAPWGAFYVPLLTRPALRLRPDSTLDLRSFGKIDSIMHFYIDMQTATLPEVRRSGANLALVRADSARAVDSLLKLILTGQATFIERGEDPFRFREVNDEGVTVLRHWQELDEVRNGIVGKFISAQTNGRVFVDLGDDNRNGTVEYSANAERSEKLINNVDYYYAVRAYDEGDFYAGQPSKLNDKSSSNTITVQPKAARPGNKAQFSLSIDEQNRQRLGGLYNIRLLVNDDQRFNQLFAGRRLELEFNRQWFPMFHKGNQNDVVALYGLSATLRDAQTRKEVAVWESALPPVLCPSTTAEAFPFGYFTEQAKTWLRTDYVGLSSSDSVLLDSTFNAETGAIAVDTIRFHQEDNRGKYVRGGSFETTAQCLPDKYALGTVGLAFDYIIEQQGGNYRADSCYVASSANGVQNFVVAPGFTSLYPGTQNALTATSTSYNNGPGAYELTFRAGGRETITTKFALNTTDDVGKDSTMTFDVEYLEYDIRNIYSVDSTVKVQYDFNLRPQQLNFAQIDPAEQRNFPNAELVTPGNFASASYGWRNSRNGEWSAARLRFYAAEVNSGRPVGKQLRYYKSRNLSTTGRDTLDFCHVVTIAGSQFVIDPSLRNRRASAITITGTAPTSQNPPTSFPNGDFQPGDKIILTTRGGAFGFPFDSTKLFLDVAQYDPGVTGNAYSESQLEQIQVAPNPYYISHEGVSSPFNQKVYFTRLPRECKISIYTTSGDLVQVIDHKEQTSNGSIDRSDIGADVWDLITRSAQSKRRAASQMFIAKIEAGGESIIRKFSVVTGPARFTGEGE